VPPLQAETLLAVLAWGEGRPGQSAERADRAGVELPGRATSRCHLRRGGNAPPVTEMPEPFAAAAEVFDEVAQVHSATAAKLELLASHCRPDSPDQVDLLGRAVVERSLAAATGRAAEARRLP
jgi:hypothetical protein